MKHPRKLITALALTGALCVTALAAGGARDITVFPAPKVLINGETFVPRDVTGREVPVFAYEETTYIPIRAVSEAFGLTVDYDAARQTAVISGTASGAAVTAPDPDVIYVLSDAPETAVMEDGTQQTFYSDVEWDLHWLEGDGFQLKSAELVSGVLPEGIALSDNKFAGQCLGPADEYVVVRVTPKKGEAVDFTFRFQFTEAGEFNAAPVVIWGREGDEVHTYIDNHYNGILYTGDDLFYGADDVAHGLGSSPIGTRAALDALAEHGLTMGYETQTDGAFYWADNFIGGTLTGATDGWVKLSIPVYAGSGSDSRRVDDQGTLQPGSWRVTDIGTESMRVVNGCVDVYLNIIGFGS